VKTYKSYIQIDKIDIVSKSDEPSSENCDKVFNYK